MKSAPAAAEAAYSPRITAAVTAAGICLFNLLNPMILQAAGTVALRGHVPTEAQRLVPINRVDPSKRLNLAIGMPLRNYEVLTNFIREVYDPNSSQFRQFLSPEKFAELFAPTAEDYQTALSFAQEQGFTVTRTYGNRLILDVDAAAGDVEKTFHLNLQVYQHPTENRTFYAPDRDPSVEGGVPILDVSGLDDFKIPRPLVHKTDHQLKNNAAQPEYGSGPGGTYRGNDFRSAYAPNVVATGSGQAVGLLEFDGYYANDITSYETQAGLPNVPLTNVLLDGFNGTPAGANIEVALDIEVAIAMAPGLSQVIVYEAGPSGLPNDILNRMASDNLAKQLSSSWTWSGGPSSTTDNIFLQLASQGQTFFQASGDDGAYATSIPQPADNPYVTVVGGTTLSTSGPGGSWTGETTWSWYNSGSGTNAGSGGVSTSYTIPSWQQGVSMASNQGSTTMRNIPDVALTADNIWVTYNNGGSGAVGGTSCAAPLWAGFMALINQQALGNGKQPIGSLNPSIYSIGTSSGYNAAFHDITTGNNTNKSSPSKFFAVSGFDLCTGWGSPAGSGLINALAGAGAPQVVSNSLALVVESCTNNAVDPGETVTMNFGLINTGSANTTNLVAALQTSGGVTSPSAAQTYGALTAGGAAVVRPFSFTATGNCGGTVTGTLQLQDGGSNLGTINFVIPLGAPTPVTTLSQNFDGVTSPALPTGWTTAVTSGTQSSWSTTNGVYDTAPNSAFVPDAGTAAQTELVSPVFSIASTSAQLTFRHNYNLATHTTSHPRSTNYYDGGVLQISIGGGAFADVVTAGGSFVSGGYNCTLSTGTSNPLPGGAAWGGSSSGWVTTAVNLPAAAAGQTVQLKWALGTGINTSVTVGWFVDSITVQDTSFNCCSPDADVGVSQSAAPNPGAVGQNLVYTLTIANTGPSAASNVAVTDSLPGAVTFISASPGCTNVGGNVSCLIGTLAAAATSNLWVTVSPTTQGSVSNYVSVSTSSTDPNTANNTSVSIISVYVPPGIAAQPTNETTKVGGGAMFNVTSTGSAPLSYQWIFGSAPIAGATTTSLALANVQSSQAGNYDVIVSNPSGSVTSTVATLTVLVPPSISAQPTNVAIVLGSSAGFQVGAAGSAPLAYQWMFNGAALSGDTSSSLLLNNAQTNQSGAYCVVVTNNAGSITSLVANLNVLVQPFLTKQPSSQTALQGSNVLFQAAAAGSAPLGYQWFFGGTSLAGATSTALGLTNVQSGQAGNYTLVVTNSAGAATSSVAQLTVLIPPVITTQPTNQTVAAGGTVSFQVTATGTAPLVYQWWFNGTNATGLNTNTLQLTSVQVNQGGGYSVVVTNSAGSVTSTVAILTIGTSPSVTQQPSSVTVVQGQTAVFNIGASGDGPLSYQWRFNGAPVVTGTGSSYSVSGATLANSGGYDVIVNNSYGSVTSSVAQLTVLIPPGIVTQPTNVTIAAGSNTSLVVNASGTAPLSYQWWFDGTNSVGSNTNVLSLTNVQASQAGGYCVVITNAGGSVTSTVATLTIGTPPSITQQPSSLTVNQGQAATFSVAVNGDSPLGFQWRFNGTSIAGGSGSSYTVTGALSANAGGYDAVVTNAYGSTTSVVAQLTVLMPPVITSQPTNQIIVAGGSGIFQVSASGSSPMSYQWWFNGTNAIGGNTNALALAGVMTSQAGLYTAVVSNAAGSITSAVANLTVGTPPTITQQPTGLTLLQGQTATFSVSASGDTPLGYEWRFKGTPISSGTANSYAVAGVTPANAGSYDTVVTNAYGVVTSAVAQLTVLVPPTINTQPTNQTIVAGNTAEFQVSASGTSPLNYQWYFNATNAIGANTNSLNLTKAQANQTGSYSVVVSNAAGSTTSTLATLTVLLSPSISVQPTNQTVGVGSNVSFYATATGSSPLNYQWSLNGVGIPSATSQILSLSNVQPTQAGIYAVSVTNTAGSAISTGAYLKVLVPPSLQNLLSSDSNFSVPVSSVAGLNYLLEYKNNLQDPAWNAVSSWVPGTGSMLMLQDTNVVSGSRFYRVRCE